MAIQNKPEKVERSEHQMAGKEMQGCEALLQVLADEGVDTIFGYSGGAILPTYDASFSLQRRKRRQRRAHQAWSFRLTSRVRDSWPPATPAIDR